MHKKEPQKKISLWLPIRWLKIFDEEARRTCTSRTQLIRNLMVGRCLKGDPK